MAEQFRQLAAEAQRRGQIKLFIQAANWIIEELERTPLEFGESWVTNPASDLVFRRGHAGPLSVEYAVREDARVVFIRRFILKRQIK